MIRAAPGWAIAVACVSSGLLFMARGSYMPYFFPLYQGVSGLDYAATAVLLNIYLAANSLASPLVGLLVDRWSALQTMVLALFVNAATLALTLSAPGFWVLALSVGLLGMTFTMARVAFNKTMIGASDEDSLRRSVSIRATLMTGGSFAGNVAAAWLVAHGHTVAQVVFFHAVFSSAWLCSILGRREDPRGTNGKALFWSHLPGALANRPFHRDLLRLSMALLPYGCWGTVIPKFVLDHFDNAALIPAMYACSTTVIVALSYPFNQVVAPWCHRRGFGQEAWPSVAAALFLGGLAAIAAADGPGMLCIGALAFGLGEILFTPCMDEAVKRNATPQASGTYIGLVQFTEGAARLAGSMVALGLYGAMRSESQSQWVWPCTLAFFLTTTLAASMILRRARH